MKIIDKYDNSMDFIESILQEHIDDIDFHRIPTDREITDIETLPYLFKEASDTLYKALRNDTKDIAILVDSDVDGLTSSTLMYRFLRDDLEFPESQLKFIMPEGKTHGLTVEVMNTVLKLKPQLIIIPDAATNDIKQQEILKENNIDYIILDHHEINTKTQQVENGYVINNQELEMNKNLTGVGMAYVFCKYYANKFNNFDVDKYLDLVAIGQVADVADVSDPEIRYYVVKGLNHIQNPFIQAILDRKGISEPTGRDMSFSVISLLNALTRVGTVVEKHDMIKQLVNDSQTTETVEIRKKNKHTGKFDKIPTSMTQQEIVAKECEKIKTKQDKIVRETINKELLEYIPMESIDLYIMDYEVPSSVTGLIAMKLTGKSMKPTLVGKDYGDYYSGSLRTGNDFDLKNYLQESELFDWVSGHAQAAGWKIQKDNIDKLLEYTEKNPIEHDSTYYVDLLETSISDDPIYQVEINKGLFGGKVNYPLFGYEDISFHKKCITTRGSMLTLFDNGVKFVMFNAPDSLIESINDNIVDDRIVVNLVGEPIINHFNGRESPQIVIKDIEILKQENEIEINWGIDF